MRKALGKGLEALLKQTTPEGSVAMEDRKNSAEKIEISQIHPNRFQPRRIFNDESLQELSESIKTHGLAQPIIIAQTANPGQYELVAGERRLRAAQLAGLTEIDVIIRPSLSDEQMLALALVENIQREDLNPIDTALAFKELTTKFNIPQTELAKYCGKSKSSISNSLRLLELDPAIQKSIQSGAITEGHARALLTLPDKNLRMHLFQLTVERHLSVRQVEDLARESANKGDARTPKAKLPKSAEILALENSLQKSLATKVELKILRSPEKGSIIIHYQSLEDLDRITAKLSK